MTFRKNLVIAALVAQVISIPFLLAGQLSLRDTGVSGLDRLIKGGTAATLFVSLFFVRGSRVHITRSRLRIAMALALILVAYATHIFASGVLDPDAVGEVFRLAVYVLLVLGMGVTFLEAKDLRRLLALLVITGVGTSVLAVINSYVGSAINRGRYVGTLVRAGSDIVDSNILGGFIVVCALSALALAFSERGWRRYMLLLAFVVCSTGRFWTFSSGSLLGEIVALTVFSFLVVRYVRAGPLTITVILGAIGAVGYFLISRGLAETLLYRLLLSDPYVYNESVGSRVAQYVGVWSTFSAHPLLLITGVGAADVTTVTGVGLGFHNSLLRPLVVGGVIAFVAYIYINWTTARAMYKWARSRGNGSDHILGAGVLSIYAGWFVQSLTIPADTSTVNLLIILLMTAVALGPDGVQGRPSTIGARDEQFSGYRQPTRDVRS